MLTEEIPQPASLLTFPQGGVNFDLVFNRESPARVTFVTGVMAKKKRISRNF